MEASKKRKIVEEVFPDVAPTAVESLEGGEIPSCVTTHNIKTENTDLKSSITGFLKRKQNEIAILTEELILDNQQKAGEIDFWKREVQLLKEEKKQANIKIKNMFQKVEKTDLENSKLDDDIKNKGAIISELQHVLAQKEKKSLDLNAFNNQLSETVKNLEHDIEALKKDGRDKQAIRLEAENLYISELENKVSKLEYQSKTILSEKEKILSESSLKLNEFKQTISCMKLAEKEQNEAISNLNISLKVKYQEETKFEAELNDQLKQFTIQNKTFNSQIEALKATNLELMNQNAMLVQKFKTSYIVKMKEEFEMELNSAKERNKITMDSLIHEAEVAAEAASKNENLKTIITEKENQVTRLQETIHSLQFQTNCIKNKIIKIIEDEAIVNADLDLFGMICAKFEKLSKVSKDKLDEKDKLIERLQARQDQADQPALFRKLAEKMGESYESGWDI